MNWIFASLPFLVFIVGTWIVLGVMVVRRVFGFNSGLTVSTLSLPVGLISYLLFINALSYFIFVPLTIWIVNLGVWAVFFYTNRFPLPALEWEIDQRTRLGLAAAGGVIFALVLFINARDAFIDAPGHAGIIQLIASGNFPPRFQCNPDDAAAYHYGANMLGAAVVDTASITPWNSQDVLAAYEVLCICALVILIVWRRTTSIRACLLGVFLTFTIGQVVWLLLPLMNPGWAHLMHGNVKTDELTSLMYTLQDSPWSYSILTPGFITPTLGYSHLSIAWEFGPITILLFLALLETPFQRRWVKTLALGYLLGTVALLQSAALIMLAVGFAALLLLTLIRPRRFSLDFNPWAVIAFSLLIAAIQGGIITDGVAGYMAGKSDSTTSFTRTPLTLPSCPVGDNDFSCAVLSLANMGVIPFLLPSFAGLTFRGRKDNAQIMMIFSALAAYLTPLIFSYGYIQWNLLRVISFASWSLVVFMTPWFYRQLTSGGKARWITALMLVISTYSGILTLWMLVDGRWIDDGGAADFSPMVPEEDLAMMEQARYVPLNAIVFDSSPCEASTGSRPAYVLGRYTRTALDRTSWMTTPEGFDELLKRPSADAMREAGYTHVYIDQTWFNSLDQTGQDDLKTGNYERIAITGNEERFRILLRVCGRDEQCELNPDIFPSDFSKSQSEPVSTSP